MDAFAALGDSFTEGTGCPQRVRWADRVAAALNGDGRLVYRNLAREGATSADVLEQVPAALAIDPDLVTVICGANDVLVSARPDIDGFSERFDAILERLLASLPEATVVTATVPERWRFIELGPRTTRRVNEGIQQVNEHIRELASARAVPYLEVVGHPGLDDPQNFSPDGLHPSLLGHERAAREFQRLLAELPRRSRNGAS